MPTLVYPWEDINITISGNPSASTSLKWGWESYERTKSGLPKAKSGNEKKSKSVNGKIPLLEAVHIDEGLNLFNKDFI